MQKGKWWENFYFWVNYYLSHATQAKVMLYWISNMQQAEWHKQWNVSQLLNYIPVPFVTLQNWRNFNEIRGPELTV